MGDHIRRVMGLNAGQPIEVSHTAGIYNLIEQHTRERKGEGAEWKEREGRLRRLLPPPPEPVVDPGDALPPVDRRSRRTTELLGGRIRGLQELEGLDNEREEREEPIINNTLNPIQNPRRYTVRQLATNGNTNENEELENENGRLGQAPRRIMRASRARMVADTH